MRHNERQLVLQLLRENNAEPTKRRNVYRLPGRGVVRLPLGDGGWSQALTQLRRLLKIKPTTDLIIIESEPVEPSFTNWTNKYVPPDKPKEPSPYAHLPVVKCKKLPSDREWAREHRPQAPYRPVVKVKPEPVFTLTEEEKLHAQALLRWQGEKAETDYVAECLRCKRLGQPMPTKTIETETENPMIDTPQRITMMDNIPQRIKQLEDEEREYKAAIQLLESDTKKLELKIKENGQAMACYREALDGVVVHRAALAGKTAPSARAPRAEGSPGLRARARQRADTILALLDQRGDEIETHAVFKHIQQNEPDITAGAIYQQLRGLAKKGRLSQRERGGKTFWVLAQRASGGSLPTHAAVA